MVMKRPAGFTLIELAIILVIVGLLAGGLLLPLTTQLDMAKFQETHKLLNQARESLVNYALLNGRLPCPAIDAVEGIENSTLCDEEGYLPWATLVTNSFDAWGQPLRYRVDAKYVTTLPNPPTTTKQLAVRDYDGNDLVTTDIVAVVLSYGKNGHLAGLTADTWENIFIPKAYAEPTTSTAVGKIYYTQGTLAQKNSDDAITWITQDSLVGRLVIAGKLQIKTNTALPTTTIPCGERSCP